MTAFRVQPLAECHREMFGDLVLTSLSPLRKDSPTRIVQSVSYDMGVRRASMGSVPVVNSAESDTRRASALVDQLLMDIYDSVHTTTDYNSTSGKSHKSSWVEAVNLRQNDIEEIKSSLSCLKNYVERMGSVLVRQLKRRDAMRRQRDAYCDIITKQLVKCVPQGDTSEEMRFSIQPLPGDTGYSQWVTAMKMVAQLPGGIPPEFRRRLWLTLADRHLLAKGVDWPKVERTCFSEWSHPTDAELGVQIVKDLHRTGCSLFCGEDGQENQVLLKRVLLAYARWNKAVGYCQGFNMLAALILQVTDKCESDALKLMIYLIEGVLPDSYFADSLRGLSVDMAVFRELLRTRFPRLSKHLDNLQNAAKDGSRSYEPPLTNVFTMQWFLTLFCNCLPQLTVLRIWDLILLEGNEILLRTALAIWQVLTERILGVRSADEFYCMMGVLTRELLEFELVDGNTLIKSVVAIGPLTELGTLREHYLYNINPWGTNLPQAVDKQLKLYPKQSIALDISGLKKQYVKLKQRQRQAHVIFSAAISRQPPSAPPVTMNHLLLGKSALIPAKRLGPPKGAIPPARQVAPSTLHWKDAPKQTSSSSSSDTELCDEGDDISDEEDDAKGQFDNLPCDSDINLMKNDNTSATVKLGTNTPSNSNNPKNDSSEAEDNLIVFKSESDEENFDFEQFLSDRLKVRDVAEEKVDFARRNSTRALQIIQENSLILHRILQCQSRLSPSPPLLEPIEDATNTDDAPDIADSFNNSPSIHEIIAETEEPKSPEYGSKYTSILEKSKSLDEKYNELILNKPMSRTLEELGTNLKNESTAEPKSLDTHFFTIREETACEVSTVELGSYRAVRDVSNSSLDEGVEMDASMSKDSYNSYEKRSAKFETPANITDSEKEGFKPFIPLNVAEDENFDTDFKNYLCHSRKDVTANVDSSTETERTVSQDKEAIPASSGRYDPEPEYHSTSTGGYSLDSNTLDSSRNALSSLSSPLRQTPSTTCYSFLAADEEGESPKTRSKNRRRDECDINTITKSFNLDIAMSYTSSSLKSPLKSPFRLPLSPLKSPSKSPFRSPSSPNKTFNPFPVPLNSRQNKEVPLKLGLYRK